MNHRTLNAQENLWQGQFGDDYNERNTEEQLLTGKLAFFAMALRRAQNVQSVLEFGCNIGLNLQSIQQLLPSAELHGIEINDAAHRALIARLPKVTSHKMSFMDYEPDRKFDLVFTFNVLIHVAPDSLPHVFDRIQQASGQYVMMVEYYNPEPTTISYRNQEGQLFKRDFAGDFLDQHPDFRLVDYGFVWHRDPMFPLGDDTWFLLERK